MSMILADALATAQRWLHDEVLRMPGFRGALLHGSAREPAADAPLAAFSDLDLLLFTDSSNLPLSTGKRLIEGVLLDVTVLPWQEACEPAQVLADHHLAPSFNQARLLSDPTGELAAVCQAVSAQFARRQWVERRCARATQKIRQYLGGVERASPSAERFMAWLFGTGITTHVLLVAGLRNPTVRQRYLRVRELLAEHGMQAVHETLLGLLGSASVGPGAAMHHLQALEPAFDTAAAALRTPIAFAGDLTAVARPLAIAGGRQMILAGDHREAMFWIAVSWARCMRVFHVDAPGEETRFMPAFGAMMAELGVESLDILPARAAAVEVFLPRLQQIAAAIMDRTAGENPATDR